MLDRNDVQLIGIGKDMQTWLVAHSEIDENEIRKSPLNVGIEKFVCLADVHGTRARARAAHYIYMYCRFAFLYSLSAA